MLRIMYVTLSATLKKNLFITLPSAALEGKVKKKKKDKVQMA